MRTAPSEDLSLGDKALRGPLPFENLPYEDLALGGPTLRGPSLMRTYPTRT